MIRVLSLVVFAAAAAPAVAADPWLTLPGGTGPGAGKHVVLVSGDEEYRSEEGLPQLAKILATHHGFKCTVLFAIDKNGEIDPNVRDNIPGLEALKTADLMILLTRFRDLRDDQLRHFADYLEAGKPVIGLRTATHAFNLSKGRKFPQFHFQSKEKDWDGGFGRVVLGETWVNHHGNHGSQGTRGVPAPGQENHPILKGIAKDGIFGPSDVYGVRLPLPDDCVPIVMGQVTETLKSDSKAVAGKKNDPMMPVTWTKTYPAAGGKTPRVMTTTMGSSEDFLAEGTRRMLVNGTYWALGLEEKLPAAADVAIVGEFTPSPFKNNGFKKGVKPADLAK